MPPPQSEQTLSCMRLSQTRRSPKKVGRPAASAARALRESSQFQANLVNPKANIKPVGLQKRVSSVGAAPTALKRASSAPLGPAAAKKGPAVSGSSDAVHAELAASLEDNEKLTGEVERLNTARSAWEGRAAEQGSQLARLQADIEAAQGELEAQLASARKREEALSAEVASAAEAQAQVEAERARAQAEVEAMAARAEAAEASLASASASLAELCVRSAAQEGLRRQMHETIQSLRGNIRVFCRVRPAASDAGAAAVQVPAGQVEETVLELVPGEVRLILAFTQYCHHRYCMVYGTNGGGRWGELTRAHYNLFTTSATSVYTLYTTHLHSHTKLSPRQSRASARSLTQPRVNYI